MKIMDILVKDAVILNLGVRSKPDVLAEMAAALAKVEPQIEADRLLEVLLEREALQSTGIGEGVAIPHGALAQLTEQVAALLIVPDGVDFQAIDDAQVSILFGVITPKRATGEHLKTLARVSRLLRNKDFRNRLVHAPNEQAMFDLIQTEEGGSSPSLKEPPEGASSSRGGGA